MIPRSRPFFLPLSTFVKNARRSLGDISGPIAVALLSLGLALAATAAIFGLMNEVSLKTLPVGEPSNLVRFEDLLDRGISGPLPALHMNCLGEFPAPASEGRTADSGFDSSQLGQTNSGVAPASEDAPPSRDNPFAPFHRLLCRSHNMLTGAQP
jgi:hypothetical protein